MKYFTISELIASQTATRKAIDNRPSIIARRNLEELVEHILDPLREAFGVPVLISSGYRSLALNRAIGGSTSSQHSRGEAADLTVVGHADLEVAQWIEENLPFDQLILEFPPEGWVHVSYSPRNRRQILTAKTVKGKTVYLNGLHP